MSRVVLITGASSGIGKFMAFEYAKKGASLVLCARRLDKLFELKEELENLGVKAIAVKVDVTSRETLDQAVELARGAFGPIDTVIANAGFYVQGTIEKLSDEDIARQFNTNIWGVINTFRATLEDLKATQGRFAIVSSALSYFTSKGSGAYCMSKYAVRALAETLDLELKKYKVSVTLLCPGITESEIRMVDNLGQFKEDRKERIPPRLIMPVGPAAKVMVKAIEKRKPELVTTKLAKTAVFLKRHFPRTTRMLLGRFS